MFRMNPYKAAAIAVGIILFMVLLIESGERRARKAIKGADANGNEVSYSWDRHDNGPTKVDFNFVGPAPVGQAG